MKVFRYIGEHPDLQGETALGRFNKSGEFVVQCNGHNLNGRPCRIVDGEDWAYGWHESPRADWEFSEEPKFRGTHDEVADFIRANRFILYCDVFRDDTDWVVFGSPHTE